MAQVSLPWFQGGEPFEPEVYLEDIEAFESAEAEAIKAGQASTAAVLRAQQDFLLVVLERASETEVSLKLTTSKLRFSFKQVWNAALRGDEAPLE